MLERFGPKKGGLFDYSVRNPPEFQEAIIRARWSRTCALVVSVCCFILPCPHAPNGISANTGSGRNPAVNLDLYRHTFYV